MFCGWDGWGKDGWVGFVFLPFGYGVGDNFLFKGVLNPSTKISMFCLFSPSSRGKLILFRYGCDKCNDSKSKSMIFFTGSMNLSCGTVQVQFFPFSP